MASAHLHASIGSRAKGHSAVAASAYRARAELVDERTGLAHDYSRHRSACLFSGIYAPKDAPDWTRDSAQLWNHVEAFEKHKKAELYREVEISLPHELTLEQNRRLLQDWIKENVTRKGLICEAFIHAAPRGGDERNIHAHVMIVSRRLDGTEFQRSKDKFDSYAAKQEHWAEALKAERASWEKLANRHLERYGHEARIDMGRRDGVEPTVHLGKHATALERLGVKTELGDINRAVEALNERQRAANENDAGAAPKIAEWLKDRAAEQLETLSRLAADEILEPEPGHQVADLDAALRAQIRALEATDPERFRQIMGAYAPAHFAEWLQEREAEARARQPETPATTLAGASAEATQRPSYEVENELDEAQEAENAPQPHEKPEERGEAEPAPTLAPEPPEATHAPENEPQEAEPARPSYLPQTVIPMGYSPPPQGYRDEPPAVAPEPPRGMVEPAERPELPEVGFRPGLIFLGKCLEWGIAMASRIVDAIASIFETRQERRDEREAERLKPPPVPPQLQRPPLTPEIPPPGRRSVADELRAQAKAHHEMTQQQREGVERLRDVLRDPNNPRHRGHGR